MAESQIAVSRLAPDFEWPCTTGAADGPHQVRLADFRDRWLVLVFYPRDFSLVCPTELTALSSRIDEFRRRGCDVLAVSTDSIETHERWIATPRAAGGLGQINFPLASDADGAVSRAYGVPRTAARGAARGLFVIDPNGVLQYQAVHNLSVGRRTDDVLRILSALETGGMRPENWCPECATLDPTEHFVPGSVISHYRIEQQVGAGSFAVFFRARDTVLDRSVALKVFKTGRLSSPATALAEARAAAALNHLNVCTVFAVDDTEGVPMIAMEFVAGRPLNRFIEAGPMPPPRVARVVRQIASGMAAAHASGIVRRDLSLLGGKSITRSAAPPLPSRSRAQSPFVRFQRLTSSLPSPFHATSHFN
jgi:alkyl hydroperoxide reductase subunit AhpC